MKLFLNPKPKPLCDSRRCGVSVNIWESPKIRDTLFWGTYTKDPTILGTKVGSPIFGTLVYGVRRVGFGGAWAGGLWQ